MSEVGVVIVEGESSCHRPPPTVAPPPAAGRNGKILQKRWVCDVCRVKWFLDFEEACAHEARCRAGLPSPPPAELSQGVLVGESSLTLISAEPNDWSRSEKSPSPKGRGVGGEVDSAPLGDELAVDSIVSSPSLKKEEINTVHGSRIAEIEASRDEKEGSANVVNGSENKRNRVEAIAQEDCSSLKPQLAHGGRRKSKRLRDAAAAALAKAPQLEDSDAVSSGDTASGETNLKKAKNDKSSRASGNSSSECDKPSSLKLKPTKPSSKKKRAGQVASIFLPTKGRLKASTSSFSRKGRAKCESTMEVPGVSKGEYEEHVAAENLAAQRKKRATWAGNSHTARKKQQTFNCRRDKKKALKDEVEDAKSSSSEDDCEDEYLGSPTSRSKSAAHPISKSTLSTSVLAEHHAADFFAKRKQKAAEERERQKKREAMRLALLKEKDGTAKDDGGKNEIANNAVSSSSEHLLATDSTSADDMPLFDIIADTKKTDGAHAVMFPQSSHILVLDASDADDAQDMTVTTKTCTVSTSSVLQALRSSPRYPHMKPELSISSPSEVHGRLLTHHAGLFTKADLSAGDEMTSAFNLLSSIYDQAKVTKERNKKSLASPEEHHCQLWVEKHTMTTIPDDILGVKNKEEATKLLSFVDEWKLRRHKSVQFMGQVKCKKRRQKKKSSHGYDSDDSFLEDGDGGLESVFLITGPTGSGKTRLVHAVAEQLECAVIEINSSEVRSGSALKRAIQETTQSHSSLAVSRKHASKAGDGFFGNSSKTEAFHGARSDDCYDCNDSESDEDSIHENHSLTIILIDEVDILFDEDTAFWPTLAQLSQKAKCPIVLTAASVPDELANIRFKHITLERPSSHECGMKMAEVSKSEGMRFKDNISLDGKTKGLALVAEALRCDLRKILNEMHLFRSSHSLKHSSNNAADMDNICLQQNVRYDTFSSSVEDRPIILSVEPKLVPKESHSVITVNGKNFLSTVFPNGERKADQLNLILGGGMCQHLRVVNDSKIIAVCPPCVIPAGVSDGAIYEDELSQHLDCLTCKFADVVVRKKCSNGLILESNSLIGPENDDCRWNIEYDIPLRDIDWEQKWPREKLTRKSKVRKQASETMVNKKKDGFMSSSDEHSPIQSDGADSSDDQTTQGNDNGDKEYPPKQNVAEADHIGPETMLVEAIAGIDMGDCRSVNETATMPTPRKSVPLLEGTSFDGELGRLSDAIFLEDTFTTLNIPALSGAVDGLGLHAIESSSCTDSSVNRLCEGKDKRPPSFDSLYSTGLNESGFFGSSDSYVTHPLRRRDRQLLSYSLLYSRGLGFMDNSDSFEENPDNFTNELDEEDTDAPLPQIETVVCSEDDTLLGPQPSPVTMLLPSLLRQSIQTPRNLGFPMDQRLLKFRKNCIAINALGVMHTVLANCDLWYVGLRHDDDHRAVQNNHVWLGDSVLDDPLSLDYLPYLRALAHHENRARQKVFEQMTKGNQDVNKVARKTRARSKKYLRRDYLEECAGAGAQGAGLEVKLMKLAKSHMV